MNNAHNAECPVCHDKWWFNPQKAILNQQEKQRLMQNGKLMIVCEDCVYLVDVESEQAAEWSFAY